MPHSTPGRLAPLRAATRCDPVMTRVPPLCAHTPAKKGEDLDSGQRFGVKGELLAERGGAGMREGWHGWCLRSAGYEDERGPGLGTGGGRAGGACPAGWGRGQAKKRAGSRAVPSSPMSSVTTVCGFISRCRLRATYRARSQVSSRQIRKHGNCSSRTASVGPWASLVIGGLSLTQGNGIVTWHAARLGPASGAGSHTVCDLCHAFREVFGWRVVQVIREAAPELARLAERAGVRP